MMAWTRLGSSWEHSRKTIPPFSVYLPLTPLSIVHLRDYTLIPYLLPLFSFSGSKVSCCFFGIPGIPPPSLPSTSSSSLPHCTGHLHCLLLHLCLKRGTSSLIRRH